MLQDKVEKLLTSFFEEHSELFLVDLQITTDNKIKVVIDGDKGVTLSDCVAVSRQVEHNLDREEQDFALEVTSAGATAPIQKPRQYRKNVGRVLKITMLTDEVFEGELMTVHEDSIVVAWKTKEPKPVGKGKIVVTKEKQIPVSEIKEAKVIIKF